MNNESIDPKFLSPYNPQDTEPKIYRLWEESGLFNPDVCVEKGYTDIKAEKFSIVLPPPNVTGKLHMGHAMMTAVEDLVVRYKRMQGYRTLWLPGTDHAAIATQSKVEKEISKKENKSRYDLGREELLERIGKFASESHDTIVSQVKAMGASLDWSREAFTLDETRNLAVRTVFKKMYDEGLIYRGKRIVNWDPKGQTTISDDEMVYEARKATLTTFKYSSNFPIPIATTRLETKVGDTAVAVHPDDTRYQKYIGSEYEIADFCGVPLKIKIIADKSVDKDFGTGALGVTPAHSIIDSEIADRHNLEKPQVINEYAKMIVGDERLLNKKTTEARQIISEWLKANNLLIEEKEIDQNVGTAERTGGIIEPLPKLQWFINVNKEFTIPYSEIRGIESGSRTTLKEIMRRSVENGQIKIIPDYNNKTYFHWIDNLRDWCISRQIWYGHRIPVWYKEDKIHCDIEAPKEDGWEQDNDTLDTWFSSGLWTFSTLGWPKATQDLKTYHPTDLLETGYDILFFWVARMILMTGYILGTIPFKTVYLHGLVRDASGRKMSKSLGNEMDPLDIAAKFGADAARMALVVGTAAGTDSKISEDKIKGYKNFANKLWNITRFILSSCDDKFERDYSYSKEDQKLIDYDRAFVEEITNEMNDYKFHIVAEKIYHYIWHTLADVTIEDSKKIFAEGDKSNISSRKNYLLSTLDWILRVLHPFMPFVTEEIWQALKKDNAMLMVSTWPKIK